MVRSSSVKPASTLYGKYPGQTLFVLGTSGSNNELDLSRLEKCVVIGVNDALEEWEVDYILAVDGPVVDRIVTTWLYDRPEVSLLTTPRHADRAVDDLRAINPVHSFTVHPGLRVNRTGSLRQVDNTAHYAVELAWRMLGCTGPGRIVMLGVDLRYPTEEEKRQGKMDHTWGPGATRGCKPNFAKAIAAYPKTYVDLARSGVELVTCSPWEGPLTSVLPWRKFGELMDELDGGS